MCFGIGGGIEGLYLPSWRKADRPKQSSGQELTAFEGPLTGSEALGPMSIRVSDDWEVKAKPTPSMRSGSRRSIASSRKSRFQRAAAVVLQQPETRTYLAYRNDRPPCQMVCALCTCILFLAIGMYLVVRASGVVEVAVSYSHTDGAVDFYLAEDIPGTAYVSYQLPNLLMNQKRFVESIDSRVISYSVSQPTCVGAASISDAEFLRASYDPDFQQVLNPVVQGGSYAPCGLVSMSMFLDQFVLDRLDSSLGGWVGVPMDESEVSLRWDQKWALNKIVQNGNNFTISGQQSWMQSGNFFEHWKAWTHTPASPNVRNLWAVINGGLKQGSYRLSFSKNSPIWISQWGVPAKRVIVSGMHTLGNAQSMRFVGGVCLFVAGVEVIVFAVMLALVYYSSHDARPYESKNSVEPTLLGQSQCWMGDGLA